jgi:hypothetical protein
VHLVDLMLTLTGEAPVAVCAHELGARPHAGRGRDPPRPARVPRRRARTDHDRPSLQGRDALRRAPRRLRARIPARLIRGAGAPPGGTKARGAARDSPGLRARRRRLDRARDVAQDDRPQSTASGDRRDTDPLREDPRGVRRGARATLERTRGADRPRGDRRRLPLGGDG